MTFRSNKQRKKVMMILKGSTQKPIPNNIFNKPKGDSKKPTFKIIMKKNNAYIQRTRYRNGKKLVTLKKIAS